jgi:hypothetical protein
MKKIVLSIAAAAISFGAFAQAHATDESNVTSDQISISGVLELIKMIVLVPEWQFATNTANTWAEYNNGLSLIEATPGTPPLPLPGGNDIEMRVSSTVPFTVKIKNSIWSRIGGPGAPGVNPVFQPSDFTAQGLASPEMAGPASPGGPYNVNGFWQGAFGSGSCGGNSTAAILSGFDQTLLKADGCYDRRFDIRVSLRPGYAYNHQGTYTGIVVLTAALN